MLNGNGKSAMRYVVNQAKGGVLQLDEETIQQLNDKHPKGEAAAPETLIKGVVPVNLDPIVFSALDGGMIKSVLCKQKVQLECLKPMTRCGTRWLPASKKRQQIFVRRLLR